MEAVHVHPRFTAAEPAAVDVKKPGRQVPTDRPSERLSWNIDHAGIADFPAYTEFIVFKLAVVRWGFV